MTIPAHLAGGYLAIKLIDKINPNIGLGEGGVLMLGLVGSVLPDIDFFFSKYIRDHHSTIPHTPLFWLAMYSFIYLIGILFTGLTQTLYCSSVVENYLPYDYTSRFSACWRITRRINA